MPVSCSGIPMPSRRCAGRWIAEVVLVARVVVLDDYQSVALECADWSSVTDRYEVEVIHEHLTTAEVRARLLGAEIVVAMRERTPFPAELLRELPALRLLVTTGTTNASIDLVAAADLGITVCGTTGTGNS